MGIEMGLIQNLQKTFDMRLVGVIVKLMGVKLIGVRLIGNVVDKYKGCH